MCGVDHSLQVDIQYSQIWWRWIGAVEPLRSLQLCVRIDDASICDNRVDATMRADFDSIFKELDLGLPVYDIAKKEVQVRIPSFFLQVTDKLIALLDIDVPDDYGSTPLLPISSESLLQILMHHR